MIVESYKITDAQIEACIHRMRIARFTRGSIEIAAIQAGVQLRHSCTPVAYRLAGRLIQQQRKKGNIVQEGRGLWRWLSDAEKLQ